MMTALSFLLISTLPSERSLEVTHVGGESGDTIEAACGFSMIRASYHHALEGDWHSSIGGEIGFDYADYAPDDAFGSALILGVPVRAEPIDNSKMQLRLSFDPALYLGIDQPGRLGQFIPGIQVAFGMRAGFKLTPELMVGGAFDLPFLFAIPMGNRHPFIALPVLVGPMAEYRVSDRLAITGDVGFGPHFNTDDRYGTRFAFRLLAGVVYNM